MHLAEAVMSRKDVVAKTTMLNEQQIMARSRVARIQH